MLLLEFTMTGTKHSAAYNLHKNDISVLDYIDFEVDAGNQYDKDAIKVLWQGEHIGWVPKKLGEAKSMLARLLEGADDDLWHMTAQVYSHEIDNPIDMQLIVRVSIDGAAE